MKQLVINLKIISPLTIRADQAQGGAETAQYITGTTLLGSLASAHHFMYPDQKNEFAALFLNDAVQYPNLYPASFDNRGAQNEPMSVYPLPKTAQTCKRFSGFKYRLKDDEDETERHGVRDTLIDWALYHLESVADTRKLDMMRHYSICRKPECKAIMDRFSGYYCRSDANPEKIVKAKIDTRLQAHTGINRQTGTVQQRILYNREVLEEGMEFQGVVHLPEGLVETFGTFVKDVGEDGLVRVGTGRTRGMGKVSLSMKPLNDGQVTFEGFKERLQAFNNQLHALAQAREFDITKIAQWYVAVTLHSPTIIRDDLLRYEGTLTPERLALLAGMQESPFQYVYQAASTRRITGWNELWGTPKANDYAIEAGSVFLFSCPSMPDDEALHKLYELELRGIGQRRAEGFGRIRLSDPFHREVEVI